jgi:hypothetical protein
MLAQALLAVLLAVQSFAPSVNRNFIPTSDAIDVAQSVAKGEGYSLADRTKFFFDLMLDKSGKPLFPGYITVGFYWNSDTVSAISINESTGQVLDINQCVVFDYPSVRAFGRSVRFGSGLTPLSMSEIQKETGCDSMRRLSVPRKTP